MQTYTHNNINLYQYTFTSEKIPGIRRMTVKISRNKPAKPQIFVKLLLQKSFQLSRK